MIDKPFGTAPSQADLDRVLSLATRAEVRVGAERCAVVYRPLLDELCACLRLAGANGVGADSARQIRIQFPEEALLVFAGGSVRLTSWRTSALLEDADALLAWLLRVGARFEDDGEVVGTADVAERTEAFRALVATLGEEPAVWALAERLAAGDTSALGLLEVFGVRAAVERMGDAPREALPGVVQWVLHRVRSRSWRLGEQLSEGVQQRLLDACGTATDRNRLNERFGREQLVPRATELVGAAEHGRPHRIAYDDRTVVAIDGTELVCFDAGKRRVLANVQPPSAALVVRDGAVCFLDRPGRAHCVALVGGEVRQRRRFLSGWWERRCRKALARFAAARDAALMPVLVREGPVLTADPDEDAMDGYAAWGGRTPRALAAKAFWGIDVPAARLHRVTDSGEHTSWLLDGVPRWIGYGQDEEAVVVVQRGEVFPILVGGVEVGEVDAWPRRVFVTVAGVHAVLARELGDVIVRLVR